MTRQEIFTKVARHLLRQKKKAASLDGHTCVYKTPRSGLKCAIGCLIPNKLYDPGMEGLGLEQNAQVQEVLRKVGVRCSRPVDQRFLSALQKIHDDLDITPKDWPEKLRQLAKQHKLKMPQVRS